MKWYEKAKTLQELKNEHSYYCQRKIELYRKGSQRGVAGINQNLERLRYQIEQKEKEIENERTNKLEDWTRFKKVSGRASQKRKQSKEQFNWNYTNKRTPSRHDVGVTKIKGDLKWEWHILYY